MAKQKQGTNKGNTNIQKPKKQFYIYRNEKQDNEVVVSLQDLSKKKHLKFITNCNFHPVALNDKLKDLGEGYGVRFHYCFKFFRYSISE